MTRKFFVGLTLTLITAISVSAQFSPSNARIGSIGNIYTVEDISDVFRYAAHMSKYTDDIQVTFSTPILGIKSMGDVISLGGYVRQGLVLDASNGNNFYARGRGHVNAVGTPPEDLTNPIYIPHALLGVNIGNFTLGFDMFLEWANVRFDSETSGTPSNTIKRKASLRNPGFIGSILLEIYELPVSLKGGIAFPSVSGLVETEGAAATKQEYKSDKGLFAEIGGEVGLPLGNFRLTVGADYTLESYSFKIDSNDPSNEYHTNRLALFGGIQNDLFDNGLWAVLYQWKLRAYKNDQDENTAFDRSDRYVEQVITGGAEHKWEEVWLFDSIFLRGGIELNFATHYVKTENNTTETSQRDQTDFGAEPSVGIGIGKGPFELDTKIVLTPGTGGWDRLATGPGVATVTGTLRF